MNTLESSNDETGLAGSSAAAALALRIIDWQAQDADAREADFFRRRRVVRADEDVWQNDATGGDDGITSRLAALQFYQLSIPAPAAPAGSFDQRAADHGQQLFNGPARCSTCHVPPLFTEPGWSMHTADEIGIDDFQASRSPDGRYRTTPLKGLWAHAKGGFYHDGRYPTLLAVVQHYNQVFNLRMTDTEMNDLAEYLKSL